MLESASLDKALAQKCHARICSGVLSSNQPGSGGIKYKSEFNVGGNNYSLFYKEDYANIKTYSVETADVSFFYERKNL